MSNINFANSPGLGFVTALARRENVIVFAGARNPGAAVDLQALVQQYPGKVHIVKLTLCDKAENEAAVATIMSIAGRLDVVIASAGTFSNSVVRTSAQQVSVQASASSLVLAWRLLLSRCVITSR
jgi:NAD(P)-dependent dehydrogenase (short-subunit alcohol dehydrogenase family)